MFLLEQEAGILAHGRRFQNSQLYDVWSHSFNHICIILIINNFLVNTKNWDKNSYQYYHEVVLRLKENIKFNSKMFIISVFILKDSH